MELITSFIYIKLKQNWLKYSFKNQEIPLFHKTNPKY